MPLFLFLGNRIPVGVSTVLAVRLWLAAIGICIAGASATSTAAADETTLPPEAEAVLGRFVGQWETQAQIPAQQGSDQAIELRGRGEAHWALGGRFVEFRTESTPPGQSELQIMTYDEAAAVYRQWVFDSDGYTHESVGTWDPATTTLIWRGQNAAGPFVIDDHFVTPHRLEWGLHRRTASGEMIEIITGVVTKTD